MKVGGEGVETKIIDNVLYIKSENKMLGYLNSDNPFDSEGWYCTKDIVDVLDNGFLRIIGRDSDVINVGGLKFMPSEVERVCLMFPGVKHAKAIGKNNPITGQHVEVTLETENDIDLKTIKTFFRKLLPSHMIPYKIKVSEVKISHRFKMI